MKTKWQTVKLGKILNHRSEFITIDDTVEYKRCKVQLHAKGIVLRDSISGYEIKTKKQQICRKNEFLVAEIDAKVGGYGVVPEELKGAIVSSHYFLYEIDQKKLIPQYLGYFIKTKKFHDQVSAQGSTNYAAIRPYHILDYEIPLPPLPEQRRIVGKIEEIAEQLEEANKLLSENEKKIDSLYDCFSSSIFNDKEMLKDRITIGEAIDKEILYLNRESRNPQYDEEVNEFIYVDISSVGHGPLLVNDGKGINCVDAPSRARRVIYKDDIIFSTVRPNLRTVAKVGEGLNKQICSTGYAVFTCSPEVNPEFLLYQMSSAFFIDQCMEKATGGHYPAINDNNLKKISIAVPSKKQQQALASKLKEFHKYIQATIRVQHFIEQKLNALMPSILDKAFKGEL